MFEPLGSIPWFNRCQIRACDHGTTRPVHVDTTGTGFAVVRYGSGPFAPPKHHTHAGA